MVNILTLGIRICSGRVMRNQAFHEFPAMVLLKSATIPFTELEIGYPPMS